VEVDRTTAAPHGLSAAAATAQRVAPDSGTPPAIHLPDVACATFGRRPKGHRCLPVRAAHREVAREMMSMPMMMSAPPGHWLARTPGTLTTSGSTSLMTHVLTPLEPPVHMLGAAGRQAEPLGRPRGDDAFFRYANRGDGPGVRSRCPVSPASERVRAPFWGLEWRAKPRKKWRARLDSNQRPPA
jgi:hypothetical protein